MPDFISQIITNLFYIVIVILIFEVLVPEGYRKYVEIFLGICIVLIILTPLIDSSRNLRFQYAESINKFENEFKEKEIYSEDIYRQSLIAEYKDKLKEDIKKKIKSETGIDIEIVAIKICEDFNTPHFGKIEDIKIKGGYDKKIVDILKNQYSVDRDKIKFEEVRGKDDLQS